MIVNNEKLIHFFIMTKSRLDHAQLCTAAIRVFSRFGFKRARMEDVAAELDVATGTLYRYISDKRDLYHQAVAYGLLEWQMSAKAAIDAQSDPLIQLRSYLLGGYDYLGQAGDFRTILVNDPSIFPLSSNEDQDLFHAINRGPMTILKQLLRSGIQCGRFREFDVDTVAELLYSFYIMFIIKTYVRSEVQTTRQMIEAAFELVQDGLLKPGSSWPMP